MPENTHEHARLRDANGRWLLGAPSPNAGGRPRVVAEIRDLARQHGPAAVRRLVQLMRSDDEQVAVAACRVLLDRGYGRPEQALTLAPVLTVSVGSAPVTSADEAARIYATIVGRPDVDLTGVRFATLEHQGNATPADFPEAAALAPPRPRVDNQSAPGDA